MADDPDIKQQLDKLLMKHKVQPVGWGYTDCIIKRENLIDFLNDLDKIQIKVQAITLWCHCTNYNAQAYGCPHGGGGPLSGYHEGWFSEIYHVEFKDDFACSADVLDYIFSDSSDWRNNKLYSPCVEPALWLDVPEEWRNVDEQEGKK